MTSGTAPATRVVEDRSPFGDIAGRPGRAFGTVSSDLAIDLTDPAGAQVVTAILAACLTYGDGRPVERESLWAAAIGDRIAALMAIASIGGDDRYSLPIRCPALTCGDDIEIGVSQTEIETVARRAASEHFDVRAVGVGYRLRRPTGMDQARWERAARLSASDVLVDLIVAGPVDRLTPTRVARLEVALDEHDPLICYGLDVVCPTCGLTSHHEPSLVAVAMARFRMTQSDLVDDIHDLAHAYGWSEDTILAIPAWRRNRYRALIAAGS
jgi:hypothetical protein